jgi:hypothetical protein
LRISCWYAQGFRRDAGCVVVLHSWEIGPFWCCGRSHISQVKILSEEKKGKDDDNQKKVLRIWKVSFGTVDSEANSLPPLQRHGVLEYYG